MFQAEGVWYVSQPAAAMITGMTSSALSNRRKTDNPPPYSERFKAYPLSELGEWTRHKQHSRKTKTMPGVNVPVSQKERLTQLQADKIELELRQSAAELVEVEAVTSALTNMVTMVKTRLLKIPTAVTPLVHGEPDVYIVQKRLDDSVREALEELSESWRDMNESVDATNS